MGIYIQYIYKIVVLASEPVGGRSRATELPCYLYDGKSHHNVYPVNESTVDKITS